MKTEFLRGLGLEDDVIQQIQAESGKDVTAVKTNLQSQIDTLNQQVQDLTGQVSQRDTDLGTLRTQLEEAGQSATKLSQVQQNLTELQTKYDTEKNDWQTKLSKQKYEFLAKEASNAVKFSSNAAKQMFLNGLIEKNLPVENDKLLGFEDYLTTQKTNDPGAFVVEDHNEPPKPNITTPITPQNPQPQESVFGFNFVGVRPHEK